MSSKIETTKTVVTQIAAICVGVTINLVIKTNAPTTKLASRVMVSVGSYIISGVISDAVTGTVEKKFDSLIATFEKYTKKN